MPMHMGFRWYGEGNDKISLSDIKQIPGVTSIVWALHNKMPGEIWEEHEIAEVMETTALSVPNARKPKATQTPSPWRTTSPPTNRRTRFCLRWRTAFPGT